MTVTSNIYINLASWSASTTYSVGNRIGNGVNAYHCTTAGTSASSGGPTGTGASISDGTVVWKWLSVIDYTSGNAWAASIPTTLTENIVGQLWNTGEIQIYPGADDTSWIAVNGKDTASYEILLTCAPGESFSDNPNRSSNALIYNSANGVSVKNMNTGGYSEMVWANVANMRIKGIQFASLTQGNYCAIIRAATHGRVILENCIFDGYANGTSGGEIISMYNGDLTIRNCLVVNRSSNYGRIINMGDGWYGGGMAINVTVVNLNTPYSDAFGSSYWRFSMYNCALFGMEWPIAGGVSQACNTGYNVVSASSLNGPANDTGSQFSKDPSLQFVNFGNDFKLKSGSNCIGAALVDTTNNPTGLDILGTNRGAVWDTGAHQYATGTVPGVVRQRITLIF